MWRDHLPDLASEVEGTCFGSGINEFCSEHSVCEGAVHEALYNEFNLGPCSECGWWSELVAELESGEEVCWQCERSLEDE